MPYEDDYKMWLEKMLIKMNPDWICEGMHDTEFTHDWCYKYCGKDDLYITPKCLHMFYHHIARADRKTEPQRDEFELFDREALILLIECQRERIAELLAKTEPQTDCSWK